MPRLTKYVDLEVLSPIKKLPLLNIYMVYNNLFGTGNIGRFYTNIYLKRKDESSIKFKKSYYNIKYNGILVEDSYKLDAINDSQISIKYGIGLIYNRYFIKLIDLLTMETMWEGKRYILGTNYNIGFISDDEFIEHNTYFISNIRKLKITRLPEKRAAVLSVVTDARPDWPCAYKIDRFGDKVIVITDKIIIINRSTNYKITITNDIIDWHKIDSNLYIFKDKSDIFMLKYGDKVAPVEITKRKWNKLLLKKYKCAKFSIPDELIKFSKELEILNNYMYNDLVNIVFNFLVI